jgi:hypothetical protein
MKTVNWERLTQTKIRMRSIIIIRNGNNNSFSENRHNLEPGSYLRRTPRLTMTFLAVPYRASERTVLALQWLISTQRSDPGGGESKRGWVVVRA